MLARARAIRNARRKYFRRSCPMKKALRTILLAVTAILLIAVLSACQQDGTQKPDDEKPEEVCTHNWVKETTVSGTCIAEGYEKYVCTLCGETKNEPTSLGTHTYVNHVCTVCGKRQEGDATYTSGETKVYVYTASASISGDKTYLMVIEGNGKTADYEKGKQPWASYVETVKELVVANGVTRIGNNVLNGASILKKATLSDTCSEIGDGAFSGCVMLDEFIAGEGVARVGARAFAGCVSAKELLFPASTVHFGTGAFAGCEKLRSMSIGLPSEESAEEPFFGKMFGEGDGRQKFRFDENGRNYSFAVPETLIYLEIKGNGKIARNAFQGCDGIKKITLSGAITEIEKEAFRGCQGLREFIFGEKSQETLTKIDKYAFEGCKLLGAEPEKKDEVFMQFTLPKSLITIEDFAFKNCIGMVSADVSATGITTLPRGAFAGCTALKGLTLPESLQSIGAEAFENSGLEKIKIGKNVDGIGKNAFNDCSRLTEIYIDSETICARADGDASRLFDIGRTYVFLAKDIGSKAWIEKNAPRGFVGTKCRFKAYDEKTGYYAWEVKNEKS